MQQQQAPSSADAGGGAPELVCKLGLVVMAAAAPCYLKAGASGAAGESATGLPYHFRFYCRKLP